MKSITHGWVVINPKHPSSGNEIICERTFARTRSKSIELFIEGTTMDWKHWRTKWNFRAVRAKCTIET